MEFVQNSYIYLGLQKNEMKCFLIPKPDNTLLSLENIFDCGFTNPDRPN